MALDWGWLTPRLRAGDWTCHQHGRIEPVTSGVVPACPECGATAHGVRMHKNGYPLFVEPAPATCAGPDRHPLGPSQVLLGWVGCQCPPVRRAGSRGHRTWRCSRCGDEQEAPVHEGPRPRP